MNPSPRLSNGRPVHTGTTELRLDSIVFDEMGAAELDGRQRVISIPRSNIVRIDLAHTRSVTNPLTLALLGSTLLALSLGLPVAATVISWATLHTRAEIIWGIRVWYLVAFAFPGAWMVKLAIRKGWVVVVHQLKGRRHLLFQNPPDRQAMETFVQQVRARFGYQ